VRRGKGLIIRFSGMMVPTMLKWVMTEMMRIEADDVTLEDALGMIAAEDVRASFDVPPFNRSAVDGYAVVASDTISATPTNAVDLELIGRSEAGSRHETCPSSSAENAPRSTRAALSHRAPMPSRWWNTRIGPAIG
jgi:molybdopterin biosynthesis enzyme